MGRGGPGKFMAAQGSVLEPRASPHSWVYTRLTRLTSYNKDTPSRANGCLVFGTQGTQPSLASLEIEKVLGKESRNSVRAHRYARRTHSASRSWANQGGVDTLAGRVA